jgi:hypothetical protein
MVKRRKVAKKATKKVAKKTTRRKVGRPRKAKKK